MKENDIHTEWTDADFDARCKTLLENRTAIAPKPRADMFASDARKWGRWVAAALLLSVGAGAAVLYDAEYQTAPSTLPAEAIEVPADTRVEEAISSPEEIAASKTALPAENQPDVAEPQAETAWAEDVTSPSPNEIEESSVVQPRENAEAHPAVESGESVEVTVEQELPVEGHALMESETEEVTVEATEAVEQETPPNASVPSDVNATESNEIEDESESEAEGPTLKLPLTVKPGGGHR